MELREVGEGVDDVDDVDRKVHALAPLGRGRGRGRGKVGLRVRVRVRVRVSVSVRLRVRGRVRGSVPMYLLLEQPREQPEEGLVVQQPLEVVGRSRQLQDLVRRLRQG